MMFINTKCRIFYPSTSQYWKLVVIKICSYSWFRAIQVYGGVMLDAFLHRRIGFIFKKISVLIRKDGMESSMNHTKIHFYEWITSYYWDLQSHWLVENSPVNKKHFVSNNFFNSYIFEVDAVLRLFHHGRCHVADWRHIPGVTRNC